MMEVREKLMALLSKYFDIGDSYCYNISFGERRDDG